MTSDEFILTMARGGGGGGGGGWGGGGGVVRERDSRLIFNYFPFLLTVTYSVFHCFVVVVVVLLLFCCQSVFL